MFLLKCLHLAMKVSGRVYVCYGYVTLNLFLRFYS